jgi:hypothetical protein
MKPISVQKALVAAELFAATALILAACSTSSFEENPDRCEIRIGGAALAAAREIGFDYRQHVVLACRGDDDSLRKLLLVTEQMDGEAGIDHAEVLLSLRERIGFDRFESATKKLGADRKRDIDASVEGAEKMRRGISTLNQ